MARLRLPPSVRRLLMLLAVALVVEYLVLPQVAGARKSLHLVSDANLWLALVGAGLEAASLTAYSQLTHSLLPRGSLGLGRVVRINLSTLSLSHVVPGGTAAGASLGYRLLTTAGVSGTDAGFALATQGIGSAAVLNLILWLALVVSIPLQGFDPLYGTAAIIGALLLGFIATLVILLTRGEERAATVVRAVARRLPFVRPAAAERLLRQIAARLRELTADRRLMVRAVGWAAANWLLDAASLWVFLGAFGQRARIDGLLVSYGLANILAAIPITPAGLGVIEGVLVPTLVGFGMAKGPAILGVLAWRLVNFWLPIPVGAGTYVSLRVGGGLFRSEEIARLDPTPDRNGRPSEHGAGRSPPRS